MKFIALGLLELLYWRERMFRKINIFHKNILAVVVCSLSSVVLAQDVFDLTPTVAPDIISDGIEDTNKVKMLRLPDKTLVSVFGQSQNIVQDVYDLKARDTRKPWDLVVQYSTDEGETWSTPMNFDNTAAQSSALGIIEASGPPPLFLAGSINEGYVDLASDPRVVNYSGDSDKPQVFNSGNNIVVTWNSKYCPQNQTLWPGENQRFVTYLELNGITIPYACLWSTKLQWNAGTKEFNAVGDSGELYKTQQFTSGFRDVKQDVPIPQKPGFAAVWQEDPLGLQLGGADGPGTGASGANTAGGTDLFYMWLDTNNNSATDFIANDWSTPVRFTKNKEGTKELNGPERTSHGPGIYDTGKASASRANIRLIGRRALIAWEERKSTTGIDNGKYVRYHTWPEFSDTLNLPINGCIISKPYENGRRVRVFTQPLSTGQTGLVFIYKQGEYSEGGPSDIMLRRAVGGYDPINIIPAVDSTIVGTFGEKCRSHVSNQDDDLIGDDELMDDPLTDLVNTPAMNLSGSELYNQLPGDSPDATTSANPWESALAHRGQMKGDIIVVGYSHTPDQARYEFLSESHPYNFYMKSSQDGGATWSLAYNLSNLDATSGVSVREPRIVGTAGNGPGCLDPNNITDATDCQNTKIMYIGFGLQTNVTNIEETDDVDIYMGVTHNGGLSYSSVQHITAGDVIGGSPDMIGDFETQLKVRPDGQQAFVAWTSVPGATKDVGFRELNLIDVIFDHGFE